MFHTDLLTPYWETPFHGRNYARPPPDLVANQEEYEVEKVLDARHYGKKKIRQYLVKWKGYPDSDNEWVSKEDMSADEAIWEYEERLGDKRRANRTKGRIRHLMSSSPISVTSSPSTPTHSQLLSSLSTMNSDRPKQPSLLPLQGKPPLTALKCSTLRLLQASRAPVPKMTARRWAEEQLLQARAKTEAQRRCFWLETQTQMKRKAKEAAEYSVKLRRAILVGFTPPLLSRAATLMANDTNDAASFSKTANATSNPCKPLHAASSSPTSQTSSDNSGT